MRLNDTKLIKKNDKSKKKYDNTELNKRKNKSKDKQKRNNKLETKLKYKALLGALEKNIFFAKKEYFGQDWNPHYNSII